MLLTGFTSGVFRYSTVAAVSLASHESEAPQSNRALHQWRDMVASLTSKLHAINKSCGLACTDWPSYAVFGRHIALS